MNDGFQLQTAAPWLSVIYYLALMPWALVKQEAIRKPNLGRSTSCVYFGTGQSGRDQEPARENKWTDVLP
jgi:hypothetical protein